MAVRAQQPTPPDTLRLGLKVVPYPFAIEFPEAPGVSSFWLRPRFTDWAAEWRRATTQQLAERRRGMLGPTGPSLARAAIDTTVAEPLAAAPQPTDNPLENALPDVLQQYADIGMIVKGRGELGGAWQRYKPCDPSIQFTCNPSLFPQLRPDVQFGVRVGGTISDRIHVNVDYDQRREFDAANNINVYYQGRPDEILQRIEVGDVSIRLPQSRYLTQGVPAGNFGFKTTGQLGPIDFQAVFAQQKGDLTTREFHLGGSAARGSAGLVQETSTNLDDFQYVKGQFFFVVSPDSITGTPHIDVLALQSTDAFANGRPAQGSIQVFRDERPSIQNQQQQAQLGYFLADATTAAPGPKHSGLFRRLIPGDDYLVHSSGLWLMLRAPLRADEALAIAYVTEAGDTVGVLNPERLPLGTTPTLRLVRGPSAIHQPGSPTWDFEMHQIYRVDAQTGVDPATIDLRISVGELSGGKTFRDINGKRITLLKLFGMDEDAPVEQVDNAQVFQPARLFNESQATAKIGGTYLVFPTLEPFAAPPPVPSEGLSAAQTQTALAGDANPDIYDNPDPVARESSARFRLNLSYRLKVDGVVSSFNLGALGIREASERIEVGGKRLERGSDYTIDYDIGVVTLNNPDQLFSTNPDAEIRATWEQKALFQIAPTSVFGMNARYQLGRRGELNFMGLYQGEKSLMSRPSLGIEPSAIFLGGVSGRVELGGRLIDRALSALPLLHFNSGSFLNVTGEMAMSLPNPNTRGATYVEDFEATDDLPLSLRRESWRLGSRPTDPSGATDVFPVQLDVASAMRLVWQHDFLNAQNQVVGALNAHDQIDRQINVAGNPLPETVLWLSAGDSTEHGDARKWRSLTTVLSTTGRDLSRTEYLEFYIGGNIKEGSLVFDIGNVSADAFYFDATGATSGRYPNGKRWGLGILDEEAAIAQREIWSTALDSLGLWNQECTGSRTLKYPLGDPRADCTRANGLVDTEDLNGSGVPELDDGQYFRYVVRLDQASPFLVRDGNATGTGMRLYRIPLRRGDALTRVNGATDGSWRFVRHLRMTVVGAPTTIDTLVVARMRFIGSRWAKRDSVGVVGGIVGSQPSLGGEATNFQVGPVSKLTVGNAYTPPPGITDQVADPTQQFGSSGVEFNEKSMRLAWDRLERGDRAEVYFRYPQQPRSFLSYRSLHLWAVARKGSFGPQGDQRLLVKVGTDGDNYYLYQTRLKPAPASGTIVAADWTPEIVIDFEHWFALKARAEQELIIGGPRPAGDPLVVWSQDSTYAIVLQDRARAPNLAAIRELAFAVYNGGNAVHDGEVWLDDLRLSAAMRDPGYAGNVRVDMRGGDFLSATATYATQGALFHQLNDEATYLTNGDVGISATAHLGQLLPAAWDLDMPVTLTHGRTVQDPTFLQRTDVLASQLEGLRESGGNRTRLGVTLRKRTPTANPWLGLLIDGLALRFGYNRAESGTVTSLDKSGATDAGLSYNRQIARHEFDAVPAFIESLMRAIFPARIEQSEFFRRMSGARLRWTPDALSFSTGWYDQNSRAYRYDRILRLPSDSAVVPIEAPRSGLDNDARISFRPFESLTADLSLSTARDLLDPERASQLALQRAAISEARSELGGLDLGWETNRTLGTQLNFRPFLATWLRPSISYSARYRTDRNPSYLQIISTGADSTALLQRQFAGERQLTRTLQFDAAAMATSLFGPVDTTKTLSLRRLLGVFRPIDVTWNTGINSNFERADFNPGYGYQFGFGSFGGHRFMFGDTAVNAANRDALRARTGVRLPFGTDIDVGFDRSTGLTYDLRGGRRNLLQRTWPDVRLSWQTLPIPVFMKRIIPRASLNVGYQITNRADEFGAGETFAQHRNGEERSVPVQFSIGLGGTSNATYSGTFARGNTTDPTGDAEQLGATHTVSVSSAFRAPSMFRNRLKSPITATLSMNQQEQTQCRNTLLPDGATQACVPFIDFQNRGMNLTFDTLLDQLRVGLQMSYTARQNRIGTLSGSSQFQLGFFGEFNFSAGQIPGMPR